MKNILLTLAILIPLAKTNALAQSLAKSKPSVFDVRAIAFKSAESLNNGISISWLEQTWNKCILKLVYTKGILLCLKTLGFKSVQLPVAFIFLNNKKHPLMTC